MRYVVSILLVVLVIGAVGTATYGFNDDSVPATVPVTIGTVNFSQTLCMFMAKNAIHAAESLLEFLQDVQLSPAALALVAEAEALLAEAKGLYAKGEYSTAAMLAAQAAAMLSGLL
jgi:hypothetical protein